MAPEEYSRLVEVMEAVGDPRQARGKRHTWRVIWSVLLAALASGQTNGRAIGQWVEEHAAELAGWLELPALRLPSLSTLRRALGALAPAELEAHLQRFREQLAAQATDGAPLPWQALALDGKTVRGAGRAGSPLQVVALVAHESGQVLAQAAQPVGGSEQATAAALLAQQCLSGRVVTLDALHTDVRLAQQIVAQGGYYLMVVKRNQPTLREAIACLFTNPPWQAQGAPAEMWQAHQVSKGHGRLEYRTLHSSSALNDYLVWPALQQVLQCQRRTVLLKTGLVREQTVYALTNLPPACASAEQLLTLWRGHWTIENRLHYVRDVSLAEDACRIHRGTAPLVLVALRTALIALCRAQGWRYLPDALRHYAASVPRALRLIGAIP